MTKPFRLTARDATEFEIHCSASDFLDIALPSDAVHTAIDAAGKASSVVGARLKRRGGKRGLPDHVVLHQTHAVFLEFKTRGGRLSADQVTMHARLKAAGFRVYVCRCVEDVWVAMQDAGVQLRAGVLANLPMQRMVA